jgi:hypothetical protein
MPFNVVAVFAANFLRFFKRLCRNNFGTESGGNRFLLTGGFGGVLSTKIRSESVGVYERKKKNNMGIRISNQINTLSRRDGEACIVATKIEEENSLFFV